MEIQIESWSNSRKSLVLVETLYNEGRVLQVKRRCEVEDAEFKEINKEEKEE